MAVDQSFLGRGWGFPPTFDAKEGIVHMVENVEDIAQSLNILLKTSMGERIMQPLYGCNLIEFQFEPVNNSLLGYIKNQVEKAILYHEPRIIVEKIDVTAAESFDLIEGKLSISIEYLIAATNSRYNYVFDYYLREANSPNSTVS